MPAQIFENSLAWINLSLALKWITYTFEAWIVMTLAYFIGFYFTTSDYYGKQFLISQGRISIKAKAWFERFILWFLVLGHFIPNKMVRLSLVSAMSYGAGTLSVPYHAFSLSAYPGGLLGASLSVMGGPVQAFSSFLKAFKSALALIDLDILLKYIDLYGPIALFILLALGVVTLPLPVPDETLMLVAGSLIREGKLQAIPTLLACTLGAWCGITISYFIGAYLGSYLATTKVGARLGLQGAKFIKAQAWFSRIGKWSLLVGYFIPVLRHFTGYIAGSLSFSYRQFSLFAYSGGFIWASLFLTIGYNVNVIVLFSKAMTYLSQLWYT